SVENATEYWDDDMVGFLIGCSFTFETALVDNGIRLEHIEQGRNVAMYKTSIPCAPAGVFSGPMVVSMRPLPANQVADAVRITSRYPSVQDRKSTRLNSSHVSISYAVFCLEKKQNVLPP